jgi:uncharacterized protein
MNLYARRVLVTGATGGLGQAIARALAERGARLVLTGRRTDVLEPLAQRLGAETIACDLSDRAAVERLAADAGDVDVLVANAGVSASGDVLEYTVEQLDRALDVNLRAPMVLARLIGERMAERGTGHIVFISSLNGKAASGGAAVYSATKFGMRGFAHGLRADLRPRGVGVSTVFPGFIRDAGMFAEAGVKLPAYVGTKSPEDVGAGVVRAIERDRVEVDVAPVGLRIGTAFAGIAPGVSAAIQRRFGGEEIATALSDAHRDKR